MLIGYTRVSADDQNLDLQRDALKVAGCERIFEDTVSRCQGRSYRSGRTHERVACWRYRRHMRLDRLGRSLKNLIQLAEHLETVKVGLRSLQENIDTTSSGGRLAFHLCSAHWPSSSAT